MNLGCFSPLFLQVYCGDIVYQKISAYRLYEYYEKKNFNLGPSQRMAEI